MRELSLQEGSRLKRLSTNGKYRSTRQRAMILLCSATGMSAPEIAATVLSDESHVRKVIHDFNEPRVLRRLTLTTGAGVPEKTTPGQRERIVAVARARPDTQGVALTRWSLRKLVEHLAGGGLALSREALRWLLIGAGLSHQRTRSWKWSPTPTSRQRRSVFSRFTEPDPTTVWSCASTRWGRSS